MVARILARLGWLRRSSTLRLTLLLTLIFALGMVVAIVLSINLARDAVLRRVDASLEGVASAIAANEAPGTHSAMIIVPVADLDRLPRPFANVAERGRGTVFLRHDYRQSEIWRALVSQDHTGAPILIAMPIDESDNTLDLLEGILWTTAALVLLLTLSIGLGIGFLAQRRVLRIKDTLNLLANGDLQARTGVSRSADDLGEIAQHLDTTAQELERLVAQTRHLSASLAHDLRTPLARLRSRLEMLPDGDERGAALEEAGRLSEIFDTIMRVAKIEASQGTDGFEPIDLGALLDELAETFGPVVEDAGKDLEVSSTRGATIRADRQMLIQAMANLIQNALVHGGGHVTLHARGREIGVSDDGPGVGPDQYEQIIKPMVRLDAARNSDGTGLGLALVRAVADRHGAELVLAQNEPTGLRVTLKFAKL